METIGKINFYERRELGERINVTFRFIKENWKVLLKYGALLALPFAAIQGFFMGDIFRMAMDPTSMDYTQILTSYGGYILLLMGSWIVMSSFALALLKAHEEDTLTPQTSLKDLAYFVPYIGKTLIMTLLLGGLGVVLMIAGILVALIPVLGVVVIILAAIGLLISIPALMLIYYPMYFENLNAWESLKKGFSLGWKNWGSTFVMSLVLSILFGVIQYLFMIPSYVWLFANALSPSNDLVSDGAVVGYITSFIAAFGVYLVMPASTIGIAFQYFHCREKDEHLSLQSPMDNFDNL